AIRLDEAWPQVVTFPEDSLLDRDAIGDHLHQAQARCGLLRLSPGPTMPRLAFPRPPMIGVGLAVESSIARQRHVPRFNCFGEPRVVHELHPLPARKYGR